MEKLEKIEKYLHGDMTIEETRAFEQEVANDETLAHEVELTRFELEVIGQLETDALRASLRKIREEEAANPVSGVTLRPSGGAGLRRQRWWAAAAAFALLITAALFLWTKPDKTDHFIVESINKYDYSLAQRGPDDRPIFDPNVVRILEKQDKARASDAVRYFQSFASPDSTLQLQARLRLAFSFWLAGNLGEAIQVFESVEATARNYDSIQQEAQFFSALALLQKKDFVEAHRRLESISKQPAHRYKPNADRALDLIGRPRN